MPLFKFYKLKKMRSSKYLNERTAMKRKKNIIN